MEGLSLMELGLWLNTYIAHPLVVGKVIGSNLGLTPHHN